MSGRIQASARRARAAAQASRERRARRASVRRAARSAYAARRAAVAEATPYLGLIRAPSVAAQRARMGRHVVAASYNVHRWTRLNGRAKPDPDRAVAVIEELDADVIGLQEVLRPFRGDDPLEEIADALQYHVAFVTTRLHRRGEVGNAVLSRWPMQSVEALDLSFSRLEQRAALAVRFSGGAGSLGVVVTHLALVDRTRARQVKSLLNHPHFDSGPVLLLGDMNAWRRDKATRALDRELHAHHNVNWPASFPSTRPVLALDRVYARGAQVLSLDSHETAESRRASDHLPVVASIELPRAH
jgi:endonuclease/exonuclease/phosphatase family metal-dependent hydrolase